MAREKSGTGQQNDLERCMADLFSSVSVMVQGELQVTNNQLELLEKMNNRVAEEYKAFGDVTSGLKVYVEQLNRRHETFEECIKQIDAIDQQVTEFEAVIVTLDKYVSLLESKLCSSGNQAL